MRRTLYWATVIAMTWSIPSGFAETTNPLPLKIEPPAKAEIDYILIKEKNGNSNRARIVGLLDILSLTDDGYEMSWTTESVEAGGVVVDRSSKHAGNYLLGIPVRFVSDGDGLPIKIHDRDALLKSMIESEAFAGGDAVKRKKVTEFFASMSDDVMAQIFLKAPSYMSICQGTDLEQGVLLESHGEFPSPWGNGTVLSDATYELSSIDHDTNKATIEYRSSYNPDSLKDVAEQAVSRIAPDNENLARQIRQAEVARKDTADCVVDTNTGRTTSVVFSILQTIGEKTNSDTYEISVRWIE